MGSIPWFIMNWQVMKWLGFLIRAAGATVVGVDLASCRVAAVSCFLGLGMRVKIRREWMMVREESLGE